MRLAVLTLCALAVLPAGVAHATDELDVVAGPARSAAPPPAAAEAAAPARGRAAPPPAAGRRARRAASRIDWATHRARIRAIEAGVGRSLVIAVP